MICITKDGAPGACACCSGPCPIQAWSTSARCGVSPTSVVLKGGGWGELTELSPEPCLAQPKRRAGSVFWSVRDLPYDEPTMYKTGLGDLSQMCSKFIDHYTPWSGLRRSRRHGSIRRPHQHHNTVAPRAYRNSCDRICHGKQDKKESWISGTVPRRAPRPSAADFGSTRVSTHRTPTHHPSLHVIAQRGHRASFVVHIGPRTSKPSSSRSAVALEKV